LARQPLKCSFVSGKGGVGKTCLAANFAWICARFAKTILIDLDFQNQGATGLLSSSLGDKYVDAFDLLTKEESRQGSEPTEIENNLFFIPCVSPDSRPNYSELARFSQTQEFATTLSSLLQFLADRFQFEIIILDCHGGLDRVSSAAHCLSDYTLAISEPDRVTFNGTLELLEFYQTDAQAAAVAANQYAISHESGENVQRQPIHLVVNRIPPKYRWDDLSRVYERVLGQYRDQLNLADKIISFIPDEDFIADSFGEYPFPAHLAPNSVISKKLCLLVYRLFNERFDFPKSYKPLRKLRSERARRKIERCVVSAEARNIQYIIITFALTSILYILGVFAYLAFVAVAYTPSNSKQDPFGNGAFIAVVIVFAMTLSFYVIRAAFGLMFYYRDKYNFRRKLLKATQPRPSIWQRMALARLFLLRFGTAIFPSLLVICGGVYLFVLIVFLVSYAIGAMKH
jgi:cellulose biosynthesis protein BcsQ